MKKLINISDKNWEIINSVKEEKEFSSDTQTINYLIAKYMDRKNYSDWLLDQMIKKINEEYLSRERLERFRWATQEAEKNSIVTLDILNTLLFKMDAKEKNRLDCIPIQTVEHPIIKQSRNIIKEKIAYFKQKSDERKAIEKEKNE